jgi:(1->4)-alpha-D-glucan 1-alpha-D-glucosylmutase
VIATYRLQLGPHLDFHGARALVPYLRDLGVSHLHLSPIYQARPGSTHGYDVVDPGRVSEDLGGEEAFRELCASGLGVVLDVVPNHMAADARNPYWSDPEQRQRFFDLDPVSGRHRRFFDVDDLAGVRQEDARVFDATHSLVLELLRDGLVYGLRIDHPDGLADPAGYLARLRTEGARHVWVEKILEPGEPLRNWPVEGTTGYDFLTLVDGCFVDPAGEATLTDLYRELTGEGREFWEVALEAKLQQAETAFRPEVERLRRELDYPDLAWALAVFPVYRTYVEPWNGAVAQEDQEAIAAARLPRPLERVLLLQDGGHEGFVTRFQQTTGPVMAKGVEDTAFYRYNRLIALNEVGGDPGRFARSVDELHAANLERGRRFPRTLLATSTHDAKRSSDVRARIAVLAELADEWRDRVLRFRAANDRLRRDGAPDANEEYLIYQSLLGAWPLSVDRLVGFVTKALREAKINSSWVAVNEAWESRVVDFCRRLYEHRPFLDEFVPFARRVAEAGERAALGRVLLKLASPGVPDLYQGDELWYLALVDPDNRRPVDWPRRAALLSRLRSAGLWGRETAKLALVVRGLELRARRPRAFEGPYMPLEAGQDTFAFARGEEVLAATPLRARTVDPELGLPSGLAGRWRHVVTGAEVELGPRPRLHELLTGFPVALLERC